MKAHCKKIDRDLRQEFQAVHSGIINHCASESQARVDEVVTQGHQAIGVTRQQAEQLVVQEVGVVKNQAERMLAEEVGKTKHQVDVIHHAKVEEIKQQADKIHTEKIGAVIEEGKAAIAEAQSLTSRVVNQAEQQILLARQ